VNKDDFFVDYLWKACGGSEGTVCPSNVGLWRQGPTLDVNGTFLPLHPTCLLLHPAEFHCVNSMTTKFGCSETN
jgi:hypothetical protein